LRLSRRLGRAALLDMAGYECADPHWEGAAIREGIADFDI